MGLNGSLDGLVEELERLLVQAEAEVYSAQVALDSAKKDAQRVRNMLKAAGVVEEEPKAQPQPKAQRPPRVNEETRAAVLGAVREWVELGESVLPDVPGSFTVSLLEALTDVHGSSVRTAINMLREEGVIRAAGKVPNSPRLAPMAYALVPVMEEDPPRVG